MYMESGVYPGNVYDDVVNSTYVNTYIAWRITWKSISCNTTCNKLVFLRCMYCEYISEHNIDADFAASGVNIMRMPSDIPFIVDIILRLDVLYRGIILCAGQAADP